MKIMLISLWILSVCGMVAGVAWAGDEVVAGGPAQNGPGQDAAGSKGRPHYKLQGLVTDEEGAPLPGIAVESFGLRKPLEDKLVDEQRCHGTTDREGRFEFDIDVANEVTLMADALHDNKRAGVQKTFKVDVGHVTLVMPLRRGELSGVVRDAVGQPVAGAIVESDGATVIADKEGKFTLPQLALKGWCRVAAETRRGNANLLDLYGSERVRVGRKDVVITVRGMGLPQIVMSEGRPKLLEHHVPKVGDMAPPLAESKWYHSAPLSDESPPGKVRVLAFWSVEDRRGAEELALVQAFWEAHRQEALEVIAVSNAVVNEELDEFVEAHPNYTLPMVHAIGSRDAQGEYFILLWPTYVVVGKSGKILSVGQDWKAASEAALKALAAG